MRKPAFCICKNKDTETLCKYTLDTVVQFELSKHFQLFEKLFRNKQLINNYMEGSGSATIK